MAPLLAVGRDELLGSVLWAGWIRRQFRTLHRTLAAIDRPVKLATAALVIALLGTTLVFRFGLDATWADGFYQTVGLIATGADLHGEQSPPWAKTFLGAMKLFGTALIAAFTAIFTQYLIRARLGGAFEARRIPEGGHVVVCGLGNVGFRCIEELVRLERPVVAIDALRDNPFAATVRRMGVPVIVGNAALAEVLAQARAATAGAVIAATDSELSNLEIALLTREANAKQRVVVRLNEADFAEAVRESARIRHALAIPKLAAPAFAAALYGDRVQSLITVNGKTLVVLDILVEENETHLVGKLIGQVVDEYRMLPLNLNQQAAIDRNTTLNVGDAFTVIIELTAMERMIRRQ
jgi:Trk K+ transport system NAD-binding subunit